jgi:hypothetical protein
MGIALGCSTMTGLTSKILTKLKMKKISLEMLRLTSGEVLERSQMKKITGGYGVSCSWNACGATPCCNGSEYWCVRGYCEKR